jgi:hypothetical protein
MTSDRWQRVQELFEEALSREPAEATTLLEEACGDDAELKEQVESLLSHHRKASATFMRLPERAAGGVENADRQTG